MRPFCWKYSTYDRSQNGVHAHWLWDGTNQLYQTGAYAETHAGFTGPYSVFYECKLANSEQTRTKKAGSQYARTNHFRPGPFLYKKGDVTVKIRK